MTRGVAPDVWRPMMLADPLYIDTMFDAVAARYAARLNGLTGIAITKLDVLSGLDRLGILPTRLAQIFSNLLNNASIYTDRGGRISLTAQLDGAEIVVRVRDNGVGIRSEMLPRIFDLFTQEDRSLERAQGGLGIGLTLVKKLLQMHGGSIEARSDGIGQGSEFSVRLPILAAAATEPEKPAGTKSEPSWRRSSRRAASAHRVAIPVVQRRVARRQRSSDS